MPLHHIISQMKLIPAMAQYNVTYIRMCTNYFLVQTHNLLEICNTYLPCRKGFHFESQLREHLWVHQAQGDWTCFRPKCGKRFKCKSELNAHLIAHNKKEYKCEECAYSNTDPHNLRAHQRRHSDKKPFLCPKCGKGFKWVQQRKRHLEAKSCTEGNA